MATMDSGTAAIVGSLIGSIAGVSSTLGSALLSDYLRNRKAKKLDVTRKARLKDMLSIDDRWKSIELLSAAVGASENTTKRLLLEIEARKSIGKKDTWGLLSKHPFPARVTAETDEDNSP